MRRTHVMHKRDNRRPHYFAQRDHNDKRPCLRWESAGGVSRMYIGDAVVAEVIDLNDHGFGAWGEPTYHRHDAILKAGPAECVGARRAFDSLGEAKAWCETVNARWVASSP